MHTIHIVNINIIVDILILLNVVQHHVTKNQFYQQTYFAIMFKTASMDQTKYLLPAVLVIIQRIQNKYVNQVFNVKLQVNIFHISNFVIIFETVQMDQMKY